MSEPNFMLIHSHQLQGGPRGKVNKQVKNNEWLDSILCQSIQYLFGHFMKIKVKLSVELQKRGFPKVTMVHPLGNGNLYATIHSNPSSSF